MEAFITEYSCSDSWGPVGCCLFTFNTLFSLFVNIKPIKFFTYRRAPGITAGKLMKTGILTCKKHTIMFLCDRGAPSSVKQPGTRCEPNGAGRRNGEAWPDEGSAQYYVRLRSRTRWFALTRSSRRFGVSSAITGTFHRLRSIPAPQKSSRFGIRWHGRSEGG